MHIAERTRLTTRRLACEEGHEGDRVPARDERARSVRVATMRHGSVCSDALNESEASKDRLLSVGGRLHQND